MKLRRILFAILATLLLPAVAFAHSDGPDISNVVANYAGIAKALSHDSLDGVQGYAKEILETMETHSDMMKSGEMKSDEMKAKHETMEASLQVLAKDDLTMEEARAAYKTLSEGFVPMAQMMYEKSDEDPDWAVMSCPMAKAEWIQMDGEVSNPYYGSKMLRCGKKMSALEGAGHEMPDSDDDKEEHGHHGDGH